jgi:hypothetical protein
MYTRWWVEHYIGDCAFYIGRMPWKSFRVGVAIGLRDTCVDLGWITFGWMR